MSRKTTYNSRKPTPLRTKSEYSDDVNVPLHTTENIEDRSDHIKDESPELHVNSSIYDVDEQVINHVRNNIKPYLIINNNTVYIPIMSDIGEKATHIRNYGYIKDHEGKSIHPLIAIIPKPANINKDFEKLRVTNAYNNNIIVNMKYNKNNRYQDLLSTPQPYDENIYRVILPELMDFEYEVNIWTDSYEDCNLIVEQFLYWDGKAFGEDLKKKYVCHIDGIDGEVINDIGQERIVKRSFTITSKVYITPNTKEFKSIRKTIRTSINFLPEEDL